jgi:hypothetical protein
MLQRRCQRRRGNAAGRLRGWRRALRMQRWQQAVVEPPLSGREERHLLSKRDGRRLCAVGVVMSRRPGAALERHRRGGVVAVLAFVGGDHDGGVVGRPLHVLLHGAVAVSASIVTPVLKKFSSILLRAIYSETNRATAVLNKAIKDTSYMTVSKLCCRKIRVPVLPST